MQGGQKSDRRRVEGGREDAVQGRRQWARLSFVVNRRRCSSVDLRRNIEGNGEGEGVGKEGGD